MAVAKRDSNRVSALIGVSTADGATPIRVYVDPDTHRLYVDTTVSYVGVIDNEAVNAANEGLLILGTDGSNYQILSVDSSGNLQVDILNASLAVTGTFWQATQPVSLASVPSHAVTNAGTFAVQENGAALTALQLIDNMIAGNEAQVDIVDEGDLVKEATTPTIYNVTMASADTEYSQALPANTKKFTVQCQGNYDVRFAFETGKVATPTAPYAIIKAGMNYYEDNLNLTTKTLYFGCGTAAQVLEIVCWT